MKMSTLLTETVNDKIKSGIIEDFVSFCKKELNIKGSVKIVLSDKRDGFKTLAHYDVNNFTTSVYINGRAVPDILRSLAHELVHHKQLQDGRLNDPSTQGGDGSDIENEANSLAGVLLRKYGRLKPEIYNF